MDDIRGFQFVFVNGVSTAVSGSHTLTVTINGVANTVTAAVADGSSTSVAPNGISGTLTLGSAISASVGWAVIAANASSIIRPSARTTSQALQTSDTLAMANLLDAVATMRRNNVPDVGGFYNLYLDPVSSRQLFADSDFKQLFRAAPQLPGEFKSAMISDFLGLRFLPTTEAYQQALSGVGTIRRAIVCGKGALVEGNFAGMDAHDVAPENTLISRVDDVVMATRAPLDRFAQIIAQSWYWIGAYCAPSDTTTNSNIIPTSTNSTFKRAVVIEHIS